MPFASIDLERIFRHLAEVPGLRFVLIGGTAVAAHGGTRLTDDVDLAVAFDPENIERLVAALAPLNPRPMRVGPDAKYVWDRLSIRGPWSVFNTDAGRIDLVIQLTGIDSFDGLYTRSLEYEAFGFPIRVASIQDLIAMKEAADRDRDREDVRQLLAIQKLQS